MRRRLVLSIAGVASASVLLLALPLALVLHRSHRDEAVLRLERDTVAATRAIDLGSPSGDPVEVPRGADMLAVYDQRGRRMAGRGPVSADRFVRSSLREERLVRDTAAGRLLVVVPLIRGERVTGAVRASRSDAGVTRSDRRAWLALGGLALGLALLALVAGLMLGRRLAAPLERLARAASRLGEGDFAVRAPRSGIAEMDALSGALDATAERLDALVTRERAFSADASHQLRTPLAALRIELEAMELRGDESSELPAALAQVERLQATIDTLLAVARDAPRRASVDLREAVDAAESRWHATLAAHTRPLRTVVRAERPIASASPAVVAEVLDVLIDNADRHGEGAVTLAVREVDDWLAVDVTDKGAGFTGDLDEAFERRAGRNGGHGIGLALARSLATAEGGDLRVTHAGPQPTLTLLVPRSPDSASA